VKHGLTIPTAGNRDRYIDAILKAADLPADSVVIVTNTPSYRREGVTLLHDLGPVNIQRWWNTGLRVLADRGHDVGIVLNDDVEIDRDTLPRLAQAIDDTSFTLAHPGTPGAMTGHAFALNLRHPVRPDEAYAWWYGDDQIWADAHNCHGIASVPDAHVIHHEHMWQTIHSDQLQSLADKDADTWATRSRA
jgi:hypothetical protein